MPHAAAPPPALLRLAAAAAVLGPAAPGGGCAALTATNPAEDAAVPRWWRASRVGLATAAAATSATVVRGDGELERTQPFYNWEWHVGTFEELDVDQNKKLCRTEYMKLFDGDGGEHDEFAKVELSSLFVQADVDDDGALAFPEYLFANYLQNERAIDQRLKRLAKYMPRGYVHAIDQMFFDLSERAQSSGVGLDDVGRELRRLLGITGQWQPGADKKLRALFLIADIVPDRTLNMNEMDFLHFLLREALCEAHLRHVEADKRDGANDAMGLQVEVLLRLFDGDRDGRLDLTEMIGKLPEHFAEMPSEKALYEKMVAKAFTAVDRDKDFRLSRDEVRAFVELLNSQWLLF